jgi:predicted AAA+ superfamily ATPase
LTGSNQFSLLNDVSQSLAGRTALLKLLPFSVQELLENNKDVETDEYLLKGFYPGIYQKNLNPTKAYRTYYETYIERDLRQLVNIKDIRLFQKFVRLCAGRIGNLFNANSLANEVGVTIPTIQSWASILRSSL